jgi:hypothetical protein
VGRTGKSWRTLPALGGHLADDRRGQTFQGGVKWQSSRQHLIQNNAQRIDVAARVNGELGRRIVWIEGVEMFRRHVRQRATERLIVRASRH